MAIANINARFQFQKMTKAEWEEWGDILLDGELAYEADTTKMKMGDGEHRYYDLPYIEIGEISVPDLSEEDIKKVTGPKGEKGDKGEAPLVFSSNPPEDKKVLWIKNNVRNIYKELYADKQSILYIGDLHAFTAFPDSEEGINIVLIIEEVESFNAEYIEVSNYKLKIIKSLKSIGLRQIFLRISNEDMNILRNNVDFKKSESYEYVENFVSQNSKKQYKFLRKIGEEKYLSLNVYNPASNKWEKIE